MLRKKQLYMIAILNAKESNLPLVVHPELADLFIPFHAQGTGDKAMEELIGDGFFQGVVDMVPAGVGEELLGGNRTAGPNRLEVAGKMGTPKIITPCGFDMLSCGPLERGDRGDPLWVSKDIKNRKLYRV